MDKEKKTVAIVLAAGSGKGCAEVGAAENEYPRQNAEECFNYSGL